MWVAIAWTSKVRWWDLDWAQRRRGNDEDGIEDGCGLKEEEEEHDSGQLILIMTPAYLVSESKPSSFLKQSTIVSPSSLEFDHRAQPSSSLSEEALGTPQAMAGILTHHYNVDL
ncbi:uncharacterized protein A4U43_C08F32510 [Asparagus officinalis]|nr:uncharacterized protein A4U43_C08F32510 [Asparagus officinalis]